MLNAIGVLGQNAALQPWGPNMLKIAGLCGSLRAASYNRMLMRLAESLMPASMQLDVLEWRDVPVFDADAFAKGFPPPVAALRERVRAADGLLFVTPEYNFSIPGGLKNVIDWLSRGEDQPFAMKPVAMLTATAGPLGGGRVQYDLRRMMIFLDAQTLNKPEIFVGSCASKFDPQLHVAGKSL
jgi:chromate reductase